MNSNCYILIRVLISGKFTIEELLKYIPINLYSLQRNIKIVNSFLSSLGISQIKKEKDRYYLIISSEEKKKIFLDSDFISAEQRIEYLIIKLFINKFINLELELNFLNVSRSTITRDLEIIKKDIKKYNLKIEYDPRKGLILIGNFEEYEEILCGKIAKIILEIEFIPKKLYLFLSDNILNEIKNYYNKIYHICKNLEIYLGDLSFSYICSILLIYNNINYNNINDLNKNSSINYVKNNFLYLKIKNKIDEIELPKINLFNKDTVKTYIAYILYSSKLEFYCLHKSKVLYKKFLDLFFKDFNTNKNLSYELEQQIISCFIYASFRYNNNLFYVSPNIMDKNLEFIIEKIQNLLCNLKIKISYGEIINLAVIFKKILIDNKLNSGIKVLILNHGFNKFISQEIANKLNGARISL